MKRTPLVRRTPLRSQARLKPGKPLARRTRLRPVTARQRKRLRTWAASRATAFAACNGRCAARVSPGCTGVAEQGHHVLPRRYRDDSAANCLPVCRECHDFIEHNKDEARRLGFVVRGNGSEAKC